MTPLNANGLLTATTPMLVIVATPRLFPDHRTRTHRPPSPQVKPPKTKGGPNKGKPKR